jgi:hypothetical protein
MEQVISSHSVLQYDQLNHVVKRMVPGRVQPPEMVCLPCPIVLALFYVLINTEIFIAGLRWLMVFFRCVRPQLFCTLGLPKDWLSCTICTLHIVSLPLAYISLSRRQSSASCSSSHACARYIQSWIKSHGLIKLYVLFSISSYMYLSY